MFWKNKISKEELERRDRRLKELETDYDRLKGCLEESIAKFQADNERYIRESERLKITEQSMIEHQKTLQLKIKATEKAGDPEQMFVMALNRAMSIVWDVNKEATKKLIDRIRKEDSIEEKEKFRKSLENFKKKFEYVDNIAKPQTILKIYDNLNEAYALAERQNKQNEMKEIKKKLDVLKYLEIIK